MKISVPMKKRWATVMPVAAAVLFALPAHSQAVSTYPTNSLTTLPDTPASTLLLPYFEVDLSNSNGMNTIMTVNNAGATSFINFGGPTSVPNQNGATAILTHVTIWSDLGVPVFGFNVYLTGYDVERINLRSVLTGTLPQTASAGQDPGDHISPKGTKSQDINFASCNGQLPYAGLTSTQIAHLQNSLTGHASASAGGQCAGLDHGDNIARGYVTVDVVNNCTTRTPADSGYTSDMTKQVQLTGEVYYNDPAHGITRGSNLVHIHSDAANTSAFSNGSYTFYGRYTGFDATDQRQPLATTFTARFLGGSFAASATAPSGTNTGAWGSVPTSSPTSGGSTSLIVWRDPKISQSYFTCGVTPSWYPLTQTVIDAFDEQEHVTTITGVTPFGAATQIVKIGGSSLPVTPLSGSLLLNLNVTVTGQPANLTDQAAAQAWVEVVEQNGTKLLNVQHRAAQLDHANNAIHVIP